MKGVQCYLFDMKNFWGGKYLLIFNTHLDPRWVTKNDKINSKFFFFFFGRKRENKFIQIKEIREFMEEIFLSLKNNNPSLELSDCGVLLIGAENFFFFPQKKFL